jgi:hypothetical protein
MSNVCKTCNVSAGLSFCSGCKMALYCSAECQRQDREAHKPLCRQFIEFARTRSTLFACGHCDGPTRIGDFSCKCLTTFCSDECRASGHIAGSVVCNQKYAFLQNYINAKLSEFERDFNLTNQQIDEYSVVLYLEARFIEGLASSPDAEGLARTMYLTSAKLGCKSSIIRIGNFSDDQIIDAYTTSLADRMRRLTAL